MLGGLHVLGGALRLALAGSAGAGLRARRVLGPLMGAVLYGGIMRGLRETAEVSEDHRHRGPSCSACIALSQWVWNPVENRNDIQFFGNDRVKIFGSKLSLTTRLIALGVGHPHRRWPAPVLLQDPDRRGDARCGRRSQPVGAQRLTTRNAWPPCRGPWARFWPCWRACSSPPSAAAPSTPRYLTLLDHRCVRGGDVRAAAQPSVFTFIGALVLGLAADLRACLFPQDVGLDQ